MTRDLGAIKNLFIFLIPISGRQMKTYRNEQTEALRANIGSKLAISLQRGPVDPNFQVEGSAHHPVFFLSKL